MTLDPSAKAIRTSASMMVAWSPSMPIVRPTRPLRPHVTTPLVMTEPGIRTAEGTSGAAQCAGRTGVRAGGGPSTDGTRQTTENVPGAISLNSR